MKQNETKRNIIQYDKISKKGLPASSSRFYGRANSFFGVSFRPWGMAKHFPWG
jgi:hypothetical protein